MLNQKAGKHPCGGQNLTGLSNTAYNFWSTKCLSCRVPDDKTVDAINISVCLTSFQSALQTLPVTVDRILDYKSLLSSHLDVDVPHVAICSSCQISYQQHLWSGRSDGAKRVDWRRYANALMCLTIWHLPKIFSNARLKAYSTCIYCCALYNNVSHWVSQIHKIINEL